MYETKNLQDPDLTTTNPYANNEIEWGVVKVGDKFDVTHIDYQAKIVKGSEENVLQKLFINTKEEPSIIRWKRNRSNL